MLSEGILRTAKELVRQSQNRSCKPKLLATQILKLQRVTALRSKSPLTDILELRELLEEHIAHRYVLDAITARVVDALDGKADSNTSVEAALDGLLERLNHSEKQLVEQLSTSLIANDRVMIIAEEEGGVIEKAICEATELSTTDGLQTAMQLTITIVKIQPDDSHVGEQMAQRLQNVKGVHVNLISDVHVTHMMTKCSKVLINGVAIDVDEGMACMTGSAMVCGVANRMRVPVIVAVSRFRMMPVGSACVIAMSMLNRYPGLIWDYDESRDDSRRKAVAMVAPAFDMISLHKFDMVVTELGGCSPEYIVNLIPAYEKNNDGDAESQTGDMQDSPALRDAVGSK